MSHSRKAVTLLAEILASMLKSPLQRWQMVKVGVPVYFLVDNEFDSSMALTLLRISLN